MSDVVRLELLGKQIQSLQLDVRALKRQIDLVQAAQTHMPTLEQFQAGMRAMDERMTEVAQEIISEVSVLVRSLQEPK